MKYVFNFSIFISDKTFLVSLIKLFLVLWRMDPNSINSIGPKNSKFKFE